MTPGGSTPRYRFGPRSTRGLIAGWTGGQIAALAGGALLSLGALRSVGGVAGLSLAILLGGAGIAAARWPMGGRTLDSWGPVLARHGAAAMVDGRLAPWRASGRFARRTSMGSLSLVAGTSNRSTFGVLEDAEAGTASVVLPVGGFGFALLDEAGRATAVDAWAGVLAAMATESRDLHRLQWIAETSTAHLPTATSHPAADEPPTVGEYAALLSQLEARLSDRRVLLVVTVRSRGAARAGLITSAKRTPQALDDEERLEALAESLSSHLSAAGLAPETLMAPNELSALLANRYGSSCSAPVGSFLGPVGVERRWSSLHTDSTWHATYWVSEWPRGEVGAGVLIPLLLGGGPQLTVAVTMAPLPPLDARRRAERERTSGAADADLRRRHGFALTARARAEQTVRLQRETELAEGHAAYLYSGYVSVRAAERETLEHRCSEVEQSAALAQLELRRLYGAQEEGWLCTLPLGRGCR